MQPCHSRHSHPEDQQDPLVQRHLADLVYHRFLAIPEFRVSQALQPDLDYRRVPVGHVLQSLLACPADLRFLDYLGRRVVHVAQGHQLSLRTRGDPSCLVVPDLQLHPSYLRFPVGQLFRECRVDPQFPEGQCHPSNHARPSFPLFLVAQAVPVDQEHQLALDHLGFLRDPYLHSFQLIQGVLLFLWVPLSPALPQVLADLGFQRFLVVPAVHPVLICQAVLHLLGILAYPSNPVIQ